MNLLNINKILTYSKNRDKMKNETGVIDKLIIRCLILLLIVIAICAERKKYEKEKCINRNVVGDVCCVGRRMQKRRRKG